MKKCTKLFFLLTLTVLLSNWVHAQNSGDYRSLTSGNWNDALSWEMYNGSSWAASLTTPVGTTSVYIQDGHNITLTADGSCKDLHIGATGVLTVGASTLTVTGKLRAFTGAAPGTSSVNPSTTCITTTTGKVVFTLAGPITSANEWQGNTVGWRAEFAITGGGIATMATPFKAGDIIISSGIVSTNGDMRADLGSANTGTLTVNSGATLRFTNAGHIRRTATVATPCASVVIDGTLEYTTANIGTLYAVSTSINGTVAYTAGVAQTLSAQITTCKTLLLGGSGAKTLTTPLTIAAGGSLILSGGTTCVLNVSGTGALSYGSNGTLVMSSSSGFYEIDGTTNQIWPATSGPANLTVARNTFRVNGATFDRTLIGTLRLIGSLIVRDLATLRLANGATISRTTGALTTASTGVGSGVIFHGLAAGDKVNLVLDSSVTAAADFPVDSLFRGGSIDITLNNGITYTLGAGNRSVGNIIFNSGKIIMGNGVLAVANNITGASSANYVVTAAPFSMLKMQVGAVAKLFPVGPSAVLYHPATITNTGTADSFSVNVSTAFPTCAANTGNDWVNATWSITEAVVGGSNCTLSLDYTGAAGNGAGFNPAVAKIAHCSGTNIDYFDGSVSGSVATGSGFTTFSPFGITSDAAVMPLNLLSFSALENTGKIILKWTTSNEINVAGFYVQQSADGIDFTNIGFLKSGQSEYVFADNNPAKGMNYYRLIIMDKDGKYMYSPVVHIKVAKANAITVYPTIATDKITVTGIDVPATNFTIHTITGQVVMTGKLGVSSKEIDISRLHPGMYILRLDNTAVRFARQ